MSKIPAEHLARTACVYIRQSTPDQLVHNLESQRRQYGLAERARQLGWTSVEVIDDDLGRSGSGTRRPGFERLVAAICDGRVGAVLAIEVSRLARNGRDWHTLIEFCGLVGIGEARVDFVEFVDDLGRRVPGRADAEPGARREAGHEIGQNGKIGQRIRSAGAGHCQRAYTACSDVFDRLSHRREHDLDLSAEQISNSWRAASILHLYHIDTGHRLEQLAGHMLRSPDAG